MCDNITTDYKWITDEDYDAIIKHKQQTQKESLAKFKRIGAAYQKLIEFLDRKDIEVPAIRQWDKNIFRDFVRSMDLSSVYTTVSYGIIRDVQGMEGMSDDEKLTIPYEERCQIYSESRNYYFSFEQMNDYMVDCLRERYEGVLVINNTYDTMLFESTSMAIYYLLWMGFTGKDIGNLADTGYSKEYKVISYDGKIWSLEDYPVIGQFFDKYTRANSYKAWQWDPLADAEIVKDIKYEKGKFLIKGCRESQSVFMNSFLRTGEKYFPGLKPSDMILWSGRMDRLYKANLLGLKIERGNAGLISKIMCTPQTNTARDGTFVGEAVLRFPSYKRRREEITQL